MTATIWHRHDKTAVLKNEEGFFFPTPNCPSSSAIQYVDAWNVNLAVHVTWLTLEQKNWHNSVMPENWRLDAANIMVETPFWHCLKICQKSLISLQYEIFGHGSVEITTTMRYLFSGNLSLKSPLQILSLIDLSFDIMGNFHTCTAIAVALLFFKLWILGCF